MAAGQLLSTYAYEVAPRQESAFSGGAIGVTSQLQAALDSTFDRSKIASAPVVSFEFDPSASKRVHPVRDAALDVAFGAGPAGSAEHLGGSAPGSEHPTRGSPRLAWRRSGAHDPTLSCR